MDFASNGERVFYITSAGANIIATASDNSLQFRTRNDGVVDFGLLNGSNGLQVTRYNTAGTFVDNGLIIGKPEGDGGVLFRDGNSATPSISFQNDTNTGIFRFTTDQIGFSAGGTRAMVITNAAVYFENSNLYFKDGTLGAPALAFNSDTDTGFYRIGSGRIGFVSNGILLGSLLSNENDIFQLRAGITASNNVAYGLSLTTSAGDGRWKLGLDGADNTILRLDRWSGASFTDTFMRVTSSTASINYRTYFTSAVNHQPVVNASVSGTYSVDMSSSNVFNLTLTGNTTLTTSNQYEGSYIIRVRQDGTGNRSLTLNPDGRFIGTSALSIGTASNDISVIQLVHIGTQSIVTSQKNLTSL